jgi:hypothetical protein
MLYSRLGALRCEKWDANVQNFRPSDLRYAKLIISADARGGGAKAKTRTGRIELLGEATATQRTHFQSFPPSRRAFRQAQKNCGIKAYNIEQRLYRRSIINWIKSIAQHAHPFCRSHCFHCVFAAAKSFIMCARMHLFYVYADALLHWTHHYTR